MRGLTIAVVLLAVGFVGYVVYTQVADRLPASEPKAEKDPGADAQDGRPAAASAERSDRRPQVSEHERQVRRWIDKLRRNQDELEAIAELGALEAEEAVGEIARMLDEHRDFYVRLASATALGRIGSWEATGPLADALLDVDELVRTAADESLQAITKHKIEGFAPTDGAERRAAWKQAWETWLASNQPSGK